MMFERLPDWVNVAGEWMVAIFLGLAVIALALLIYVIIVYAIPVIKGKDEQ